MKVSNIKKLMAGLAFSTLAVTMLTMNSCVESKMVADKSGAQLWAENCQRCHNTPAPTTFAGEEWKTVGMHMQSRALLTNAERDKIVAFLQTFNQ